MMLKIINLDFGFRGKDYLWFGANIETFDLLFVHQIFIFVQIGKQDGPFKHLSQIGELNVPRSLLLLVVFRRQL